MAYVFLSVSSLSKRSSPPRELCVLSPVKGIPTTYTGVHSLLVQHDVYNFIVRRQRGSVKVLMVRQSSRSVTVCHSPGIHMDHKNLMCSATNPDPTTCRAEKNKLPIYRLLSDRFMVKFVTDETAGILVPTPYPCSLTS